MRYAVIVLPIVSLVLFSTNIDALTIHVPGDEPTIQAGIDAALDGDTVLVADGIYSGEGNRNIDFDGKAIVVVSENGYEMTIVDCEYNGRGFNFHSGEDSNSVLKGFTIRNGNGAGGPGGGIYCGYSSPTILKCYLQDNRSGIGGGLACDDYASPTIEECIFTGNYGEPYGGGIHLQGSSEARIRECRFFDNEAETVGGGIRCAEASPEISNCIFANNFGRNGGGGIEIRSYSCPTVENCVFINNRSQSWDGGGLKITNTAFPEIIGCIVVDNMAPNGAGVLVRSGSHPVFANCTIVNNSATSGHGGGLFIDLNATATFTNTIFWGNGPDEIEIGAGSVNISYSDILGGWPGIGNIDDDPLFMKFKGYEYLLDSGSPCIDTGDPSIEDLISDWHPDWPDWLPNGERSDMGAYGGPMNKGWSIFQ